MDPVLTFALGMIVGMVAMLAFIVAASNVEGD